MIKSKKKLFLLIIVVLLLIPVIYSYYSYTGIKVNNKYADEFDHDLINVVNQKNEFDMKEVTKFEWDTMIVFGPYTSRDEMESVIGREWTTYTYFGYLLFKIPLLGDYPLDDDPLNKIVFMKDDQIVVDVTFNRYKVDLTEINEITYYEEAHFTIKKDTVLQKVIND
ncbi:hypothetical protein [Paenibacillus wynnii]|uniref:DUF4825 domain-containing protein n=1 Tax=Paenibacillus wynnii TaxID=268407 RepID=A0A098M2W4_9BACL|nr:hypothetical protein [Paenibacillus wynnii]KGE16805.1 hypothetical protein PWYN_19120 [Paenibacillus wynnii]